MTTVRQVRNLWLPLLLILGVAFGLLGCGGSGDRANPQTGVQVRLNTTSVNLAPGGTQNFTATVTGSSNTAVNWNVIGGAANGSITSAGVYTAPTAPGTYTISAQSQADPAVTATATVRVSSGANVTISPQNQTLRLGDTLQFSANVTGVADTGVTWIVQGTGSGGTISPSGLYTAPLVAGTYTVSARSNADPTRQATTQVTVVPGTEVRLDFPTTELIAIPGSTITFRARVIGNTNRNFTWSVTQPGGGTITSEGVYTAPTTPGTYTIVATSTADPARTASQTVRVLDTARVRFAIQGRSDMVILLNRTAAPNTTANFVSLVNSGFYVGTKIHRVETTLFQGGDPLTKTLPVNDPQIGTGGPGYTIDLENTGIAHVRGVISMARTTDPNSAGSQFFVMKASEPSYDGQYASFGTVQGDLSLLDLIEIGDTITAATVEE